MKAFLLYITAGAVIINIAGNAFANSTEGIKAARNALSASPRPAALLCMSDNLALAALSVARELNLQVPEQLSIVGFDDTPAASVNHPEVTTVYQPSLEKGRLAAKMALNPERVMGNTISQVVDTSSLPSQKTHLNMLTPDN